MQSTMDSAASPQAAGTRAVGRRTSILSTVSVPFSIHTLNDDPADAPPATSSVTAADSMESMLASPEVKAADEDTVESPVLSMVMAQPAESMLPTDERLSGELQQSTASGTRKRQSFVPIRPAAQQIHRQAAPRQRALRMRLNRLLIDPFAFMLPRHGGLGKLTTTTKTDQAISPSLASQTVAASQALTPRIAAATKVSSPKVTSRPPNPMIDAMQAQLSIPSPTSDRTPRPDQPRRMRSFRVASSEEMEKLQRRHAILMARLQQFPRTDSKHV